MQMNKDIDTSTALKTIGIDTPKAAPTAAARVFKPLDFYTRLRKKSIKCKCVNGAIVEGTLVAYNNYELLIEIANGDEIILSKHSVLFTVLSKPHAPAVASASVPTIPTPAMAARVGSPEAHSDVISG